MEEIFSPKQVAAAINVSESSIKRWCDQGVITTTKTHGGHRRITLDGLLSFLETTKRQILNPCPLGMGGMIVANDADASSKGELDERGLRTGLEQALVRGDEKECRRIVSRWYASRQTIASVSDELLAPTFHRIGELWHASVIEVFQERRACEICVRLIDEYRRLTVEPLATSPYALGCTSSGDHYSLPGKLIEVVLREAGWRATNLGSNIPFKSLEAAVRYEVPNLVWLSVSFIDDESTFIREFNDFSRAIPRTVSLVVGGRVLTDRLRLQLRYTVHCDTMRQLSRLAGLLRSASREASTPYLPMQNRLNSASSISSV